MKKLISMILTAVTVLCCACFAAAEARGTYIPEADCYVSAPEGWTLITSETKPEDLGVEQSVIDGLLTNRTIACMVGKNAGEFLDISVDDDPTILDGNLSTEIEREAFLSNTKASFETLGYSVEDMHWEERGQRKWLRAEYALESQPEIKNSMAVTHHCGKEICFITYGQDGWTLEEQRQFLEALMESFWSETPPMTFDSFPEKIPERLDVSVTDHLLMDIPKNWDLQQAEGAAAVLSHTDVANSYIMITEMDFYASLTEEEEFVYTRAELDRYLNSRENMEEQMEGYLVAEEEMEIRGETYVRLSGLTEDGRPCVQLWHGENGWVFQFVCVGDTGGESYAELLRMVESVEYRFEEETASLPENPSTQAPETAAEDVPAAPEEKLTGGALWWLLGGVAVAAVAVIVVMMGKRRKKPVCPFCGATLPAGSRFCTACGHPLDQK